MKKIITNLKKLWTQTPSVSGDMLYGKETNKKIKDRYKKEQLLERKNV